MRVLVMGLVMMMGCWTGGPPPPMAPICRTCAAPELVAAGPPVVATAPAPAPILAPTPAPAIVVDAEPVAANRPPRTAEAAVAEPAVTATLGVTAAPIESDDWSGARFSGGRLVAEIVAGVLVGGGLGLAVYEGAGEGVGGVFAGSMVSIAVAPLVEYGVGRLLGGRGSLKMTYIGGFLAFGVSTPTAPGGEQLVFVVGELLLPVMSGLFFELNSNVQAKQFQQAHGVTVGLMPRIDRGAVDGAMLGAALRW